MPRKIYNCDAGDHFWARSGWGTSRSIGYTEVTSCNNCLAFKIHTKSDLGEVTQVVTPSNNVSYPKNTG